MAKKTIEELKERFKTGMFPTQSDYEDVFDSILTAVTTDDVNGVGEDREKTLTQMLESIDTSRIPGLDDFIRNVESFLAGIEVNKTLVELLEGLKKEIEYTAGNGININDNVISANTDVLVTKSDLDRKAERSELNSIQSTVSDLESRKAERSELNSIQSTVSDLESRKAERSELNSIQSTVSDLESRKAERSELNSKANVSEIPDVSNFITRDDIPEIPDTSNFVTRDEIPTVPENVSAFNNDAGYLTEHQDLSEYATKSEIPDVSNFVTSEQIPNTDEFVTRGELPNFSEFATKGELNNKADRSELPNISELATKSELDNKANRSEIPSLEGYATEEYVNNAVANAGGSSNNGNYLKLVNDLDNYEFAKGEIVKYNGNTGTYINGADYQQKETITNGILIPTGSYKTNFTDRYRDLEWSERSNGLFLSTPNGYFTNISDEDYSIKILLYDSNSKLFCVPSDVKVGDYAITNLTGTAISFEKVTAVGQNNSSRYPESITIYGKGVFRYNNCLKKGEGGYINGNLFVGNTAYPYLYITYVDGISHMFVAESYNNAKGPQTNKNMYLSGKKTIKSIELTDFCKRALNIE